MTPYVYKWESDIFSWSSSSADGLIFDDIGAGLYGVTVLDINNCSVTESITLTGTSVPNTLTVGPSQVVCYGEALIQLSALPVTDSTSWYGDELLTDLLEVSPVLTPSSEPGVYVYYVTDTQEGCESEAAEVTVEVKPLPNPEALSDDTIVCYGDSINMFLANEGGEVYWFRDALKQDTIVVGELFTDSIMQWDTTLTYYYEVVTQGCASETDSFNILFGDTTIASFTATPEVGTVALEVEFTNTSEGVDADFDMVFWDFGTGEFSNEYAPKHTYYDAGTYEVMLIVEDYITGCIDTANTITIVTDEAASFGIPIVFSPNGDGVNDVFKVDGNNLTSVDAKIYNRWGELIYEWDLPEEVWDGRTFTGEEAPEGTYFFIISAEGVDKNGDPVSFGEDGPVTGTVTLVR